MKRRLLRLLRLVRLLKVFLENPFLVEILSATIKLTLFSLVVLMVVFKLSASAIAV